jgi:hypothetical protein
MRTRSGKQHEEDTMRKKRHTRVALLIVAMFGTMALSAQAETIPHWLSEGKEIVGGPVSVKTSGTLMFDLTQFGVTVTCKVKDTETITNPPSGGPGIDEMIAFKLSHCTEVGPAPLCATVMEVTALGLPWHSHLVSEPPVVRDVIEGIALGFRCKKGMSFGVFTGSLDPKVGSSVLEFEGGKALSGEFGTVTVKGNDSLKGPKGDKKITVS